MNKWMLICLFFLSLQASAVLNQQSIYDYDIKHWTSENGLVTNAVWAVKQDKFGYIWFGTFSGLNRFDGYQFEHFSVENTPNLASDSITLLFTDSGGYMWVGTKSGLSGFSPATLQFDRYTIFSEVSSVIEVSAGEVWVAAEQLFRIRNGQISQIELVSEAVKQLYTADNVTWIVGTEHLFRIDEQEQIVSYPLPSVLAQAPVYDLRQINGHLLIGSEAGLFQLSDNNIIEKYLLPEKEKTAVYKLFVDSQDNRWISSHRKLFHRHPDQSWQHITAKELGIAPWFTDIIEDRDHNIWLASFSDGVYRIAKSYTRRIVPPDAEPVVRSIAVTPDEQLLIATQSGVLQLDQKGHYLPVISPEDIGTQTIRDIYWPDANTLWLAADTGLLSFDLTQKRLSAPFTELQGIQVRILEPSANGRLWVGAASGLYQFYPAASLQPFALNDQLESRNITAIKQQDNVLIIGTARGVYQYQDGQLQRLGENTALFNSYITALLFLPDNTLLISTLDDDVYIRFADQQWHHLRSSNGLPHGPVVSLIYDPQTDYVWAGSLKGIFRFRITQSAISDEPQLKFDEFLSPYDRQVGTEAGRCCNGSGNAKVALWQNHYWFPSLVGMVAVSAGVDKQKTPLSQPMIKAVTGNERYVVEADIQRLTMALDDRNIAIHYAVPEYATPQKLQFRYQLQGFDKDWHPQTERREAIYTNLLPGEFRFRVQVKRADESWETARNTELMLVVPERFDETILYRGLWILLVLFCAYGLLWLVRRNTLHTQQQLERLIKQRTQELENSNLRLNELNEQLTQLTHKDSLTGLRNRRFMFEQLPKDIEHYQRNREAIQAQGKCFVLIHLDLDNFKQINDQYGQSAGDSIIQQVSGLLIRETRGSDYVVRFAGEEFILVLREIQTEKAEAFCYRLNEVLAKTAFSLPAGQKTSLTSSMGYATYPLELLGGQLISWEISLQLAEIAMYRVKHSGKNGVATLRFDPQVDAFEFEDAVHIEMQIEELLAAGLARFEQKK